MKVLISYFITVTARTADLKGQMPHRLIHSVCSVQKDWCICEELCVANVLQIRVYDVSSRTALRVSLLFPKHVATERGLLLLLEKAYSLLWGFLRKKWASGVGLPVKYWLLMSHTSHKERTSRDRSYIKFRDQKTSQFGKGGVLNL